MPKIHPSSIVSPKAEINDDVHIGPFCIIEEDVKIDSGTILLNNVNVYKGARIGKNNIFYSGAAISTTPQDLKFINEYSEVFIGDNNIIRECVTISRGTAAAFKTIIGNNCLFMAYSHVAHDCIVGDFCILANSVALAGHVEIEDFAICGGLVGVHQFVKIGKHAMIGAHSMVVKDIPPFALFSGNPIKYGGLNITGLKRRNFSAGSIELLKKGSNIIFNSELNVTQAVNKICEEFPENEELKYLVNFIRNSKRGIAR